MIEKLRNRYYEYKVGLDDYLWDIKWLRTVRSTYWQIVPYDYRPGNAWYKLKCWSYHRYTTVKPRYLPHTWMDRCDLLPHMMFEILSDFIENECSPGIVDWYWTGEGYDGKKIKRGKERIFVRDEMQQLYDWWHNIYVKWEENQPELAAWANFNEIHQINTWTELDDGTGNSLYDPKFDSEESEKESKRLIELVWKTEKEMDKELKRNLHRIINIMDYMWT